jgi:hypothetical protein
LIYPNDLDNFIRQELKFWGPVVNATELKLDE